jgi:hypothetical protein
MEVFVVTIGEYSDYGMDSIFSTRELAEARVSELKKINSHDEGRIEVWIVDEQRECVARECWTAYIDMKTGNLTEGEKSRYEFARPCQRVMDYPNWDIYPTKHPNSDKMNDLPHTIYVSSFVSQAHANKVVIEKRQQMLARKASGVFGKQPHEFSPHYGDTVE